MSYKNIALDILSNKLKNIFFCLMLFYIKRQNLSKINNCYMLSQCRILNFINILAELPGFARANYKGIFYIK